LGKILKKKHPNLFQYFVDYIAQIRKRDWCLEDGVKEYEKRQNEFLDAFRQRSDSRLHDSIKDYQRSGKVDKDGNVITHAQRKALGKAPKVQNDDRKALGKSPKGKRGRKGRSTVLEVDVLKKHHHKKKKTAAQITPRLLNKLKVGKNINLFVIKQKALLLLKFRTFQLSTKKKNNKTKCFCKQVLNYIDETQKNDYKEKLQAEMEKVCGYSNKKCSSDPFEEIKKVGDNQRKLKSSKKSSSKSSSSKINTSTETTKTATVTNKSVSRKTKRTRKSKTNNSRKSISMHRSSIKNFKKDCNKTVQPKGITIVVNNDN